MPAPLYETVRPSASARKDRPRRADARFAPRPAFSLLELVIVMAIVGIVASIGILKYSASLSRYRVEVACRRIVADLETARAQARATASSRTVQFNTATASYAVLTRAQVLASAAGTPVFLSADPYRAAMTVKTMTNNAVKFDGYGEIDGGGTVSLTVGSTTMSVAIDPLTGRASVQ